MKQYEIVSLGVNCLPRTILTRWGIKPKKADGELSCPFDLVAHSPETILKCLQTNFEGYFDDMFFKLRKRNILDFRGKGLWQKKDGTVFFHDKDCKKNDKEKLVNRIKNRIDNFNNIINTDKPILFVMALYKETDSIDKIYETLKKLRGNKPFKFLVLAFDTTIKTSNNEIEKLEIPKPIKTYDTDWNRSRFIKSELGVYVEKLICYNVEKILDKMT